MLLFPFKLIMLISIIIYYAVTSAFINILKKDRANRLIRLADNLSTVSKLALWNLGIKTKLKNSSNIDLEDNYLVLSNHLSYLDILVLSSALPSTFITSFEIKDTRFLGGLSKAAGSIFVDRVNYENIRLELSEIRDLLSKGVQVVLFPEATSSNGDTVLPFKSGLIECIFGSGKKILLITLNYRKVENNPVDNKNRDIIYWYDEMTFFPHLTALLKSGSIDVEIEITGILDPASYKSRKEISAESYSLIKESYLRNKNPG